MGVQRHTYKLVIIALAMMTVACRPDDTTPELPRRVDDDPKTFLMYDNIGSWFTADVAEAGRAVASGALADGHRVVVFHRNYSGNGGKPTIYELVRDRGASAGWSRRIIETIPASQIKLNTTNLNNILGKMRAATPEANHFGLSFGSHGTGWLPTVNPIGPLRRRVNGTDGANLSDLWDVDGRKNTRYLAYDNAEKIEVADFGAAVSGAVSGETWAWDFVIFDDCFMASVEALYEIRHTADCFIASCTEILSDGFPYDAIVRTIFSTSGWADTPAIGQAYIDHYRSLAADDGNYATISVIKTAELDALASAVRAIRTASAGYNDDVDPLSAGIQFFESRSLHIFWDLEQYMYYFSRSLPMYDAFRAQLSRTVEWQGHTEYFYSNLNYSSGTYPVEHHSGLSVFIPTSANKTQTVAALIPSWKQTAWYKAVFE